MKNNLEFYGNLLGTVLYGIQKESVKGGKNNDTLSNDFIELSPVVLPDSYAKKWNENSIDFFKIYNEEGLVSENLYRKGGMFNEKDLEQPYFQILKYTEALYDKDTFPKHTLEQLRHLKSTWVVIDSKTGKEVYEFGKFDHGYIYKNSIFCIFKNEVFNILTKEVIAKSIYSGQVLESQDYLFIQDDRNTDKSKRGVIKAHKLTGELEFIN